MSLTRRQFIPSAVSLALAATSQWPGPAVAAGVRRPIKIAVKSGMIQGGKSYLEKFQIAKEAGFDGVEPGGPFPEEDLAEILKAIQKTGVVVPGTVCPKGGRQMGSTDEQVRQEGVELFKTSLRQTQKLGGTTVLMRCRTSPSSSVTMPLKGVSSMKVPPCTAERRAKAWHTHARAAGGACGEVR